ncbi:MAG: hypothetical protein HN921_03570 [Bacteroidetes bacterium]|nr:hypothetical protein [Bacteroidota bacterium]
MRIYNYIFYKISQILAGFIESPSFIAIAVLSWLFMFNSFTLIYIISLNYEVSTFLDSYASIFGGILVFGGHYFYFYRKNYHARIYARYKIESKYSSILGSVGTILYVILSVCGFFNYAAPNMRGIILFCAMGHPLFRFSFQ